MKAGDDRLTDHINHQIEQVNQALKALNAILTERDGRANDRMIAAQRQFEEFKQTVMDRFASVNEFRGSLADLSKMMATRIELIALGEKFQPVIDRNREEINHRLQKETFDVKMGEIAEWHEGIDTWRNEIAGKGEGVFVHSQDGNGFHRGGFPRHGDHRYLLCHHQPGGH